MSDNVVTKNEPEIKRIIREIDVSDFDTTPYTQPNVIRPLPKQKDFLLSHHEAQITFYGGKPICHLSQ